MHILVMNCGSSSVKFAVLDSRDGERHLDGHLECPTGGLESALDEAMARIQQALDQGVEFQAIGHRVVHGGEVFRESTLIDASVIEAIEALASHAEQNDNVDAALDLLAPLTTSKSAKVRYRAFVRRAEIFGAKTE